MGSISCNRKAPPVAERVVVLLRNSRKYRLGSLRKNPTEGKSPLGPGPTCGLLTLSQKPTNQPVFKNYGLFMNTLFFYSCCCCLLTLPSNVYKLTAMI